MAATGRSLQQLCRAAFSLCNATSTSAAASPALVGSAASLGAGSLRSAAAAAATGSQHQACAAVGLRHLVRHFHSLGLRRAAEEGGSPAINPLQQAPTPLAPGTGGSPLSSLDFSAGGAGGEEGSLLSRAVSRGIAISPQKLNDFAKLVRGLHIEDALIQCSISPKKAAKLVHKALLSAKANAVNNQGLEAERLRVAEAWVGKGSHLKRVSMHGRGRSGMKYRYRSHLTVVLREEETEPRRRTRITPMLMERDRVWRMREAQQQQQ